MPQTEIVQPRSLKRQCDNCEYFVEYEDLEDLEIDSEDDLTGTCRRYPPQVIPGISAAAVYPDVAGASFWCGEFIPK